MAKGAASMAVDHTDATRSGWDGSLDEGVDALSLLYASGKLTYAPTACDRPNEEFMTANADGLHKLFQVIPKGNGKYSTFVKVLLRKMADGSYSMGYPHLVTMRTQARTFWDDDVVSVVHIAPRHLP
jgi:hypothetical protein